MYVYKNIYFYVPSMMVFNFIIFKRIIKEVTFYDRVDQRPPKTV